MPFLHEGIQLKGFLVYLVNERQKFIQLSVIPVHM